ncbi:hypothetical protein MMC29_004137 [Sticta canariensis]|nr:hypothetical protein [Sticta canariensis]
MPSGRWWDWEASDDYWPHQSEDAFRVYDEEEFHKARIYTNVRNVSIAFNEHGRLRRDWRDFLNWNSDNHEDLLPMSAPRPSEARNATCPKCRTGCSILRYRVTGTRIEARLRFWDLLYEKVGISRSDKEEQSRTDLLRYIQMVQVSRTGTKPEHMRSFTLQAQVSAMRFALRRGNRDLDPVQRYLRDAIFNLGCYGLHDGEYNPTSYETRRVPMWCYQVGRIERGLSPIITAVRADRRSSAELAEKTEKFFLELRREVSGSWRRSLYAEVGGDRNGLRWKMSWDLDSEEFVEDPDLFAIMG